MLNTSLRRAARTSCHGSPVPSRPTTPSIASFSPGHQRRHSSSKPPIPPNNGSPAIPASAVKQVGSARSDSKRPASESRLAKRKTTKSEAKEDVSDNNWTSTLPSVPSLQHLNQKDVNISAFFSTYRPLSITGPGPKETTLEELEKILTPKPKPKFKPPPTEVIYTLSSALENLNEAIAEKQAGGQDSNVAQKVDLIKSITRHNDGRTHHLDGQTLNLRVPSGSVKLVLEEIQNRFRPFNTPPPPAQVSQEELDIIDRENAAFEAGEGEEMLAQQLEAQVEQQQKQQDRQIAQAVSAARKIRPRLEAQIAAQQAKSARSNNNSQVAEVVMNVRRPRNADMQNGRFFTPRIVIEDAARVQNISDPATSDNNTTGVTIGRMRRGVYIPITRKPGMWAISVKRQRRLKMKKHKYKKLMRRTRNLRKRQDRL